MWSLWKEVMLVGRQRDRHGHWFTFTHQDVRAAHHNCAKMLSRGVSVPAVWEHQDVEAGDPAAWRAAYAKYTFAHVGAARVNGRGNLELRHDGPDERDRDQLLKVKFCSPKVYPSYSDSRGGEYRGATIAHVAATPTPVQFWQRPFELSRKGALYLSYAAGNDMADDEKDGKKKPDGEKDGGETPPEEKSPDTAAAGRLGPLIEALREVGMMIPDEVRDIQGLIIAVKASGGPKGGADDDLAAGGDDTANAGGPPMLMSDKRAAGYARKDREDMVRRVRACFHTGRIDRTTAQKRLRAVKAVELSYREDGEFDREPRVLATIEADEERGPWSAWKPKAGEAPGDLADVAAAEAPDALTNNPKGTEEATDLVLSLIAGPAKK